MTKYCINCGKELEEGAAACGQCGKSTGVSNNGSSSSSSSEKNVMAIIGLIISIVSLILCCGSLSWLSLIFSIVGIFTASNVGGNGKGMAIAGTIISGVGLILLISFIFLLPILGFSTFYDIAKEKIESEYEDLQFDDDPYEDYDLPTNGNSIDDYDFDYDFDY